MDTINNEWLKETSNLADLYENKEIGLDKFSDDQLVYLIYWNWGYSGTTIVNETKESEAELIKRNNPYNQIYAMQLVDITEEFY